MKRYSLSLSDELSDQMDKIAETDGGTKSDLFRNAVALYLFLHKEVNENKNSVILRAEGSQDRELVFKGVL